MIGSTIALAMILATWNHSTLNPLFEELQKQGVPISGDKRIRLPPPTMPDGLDAAAERAVLEKIVGDRYPVEEFLRDSVVAPFVLKFPDLGGRESGARGLDLWFIVYGDVDDISKNDVLEKFTSTREKDATMHALTAAELAARNLPAASAGEKNPLSKPGDTAERFVHTVAPILEKVELRHTLRCDLSRGENSLIIATLVDQRFAADRDFPNLYHRLTRNDAGDASTGPAEPYLGAGGYLKATQLAQPAGAILVEHHLIYSEPHDWFNGANLLQSKLPILLQSRIRELRREVKKK